MGDRARCAPILGAMLAAGVVVAPLAAVAAPDPGGDAPAEGSAAPDSKPPATPDAASDAKPDPGGAAADDATPDDATPAGADDPAGASASGAAAKPAPVKDPRLARKWLHAARKLVYRGDHAARAGKDDEAKQDYKNAITAYQHAIETGDDISLYLALAEVEDKVGADAAAYKHLQFLVDPNSKAKPYVIKKAQDKLDEISMKIGTVILRIKPDGTTVILADQTVGVSPLTDPLVLEPGKYKVSLTAVGFQPQEFELRVDAGSEIERTFELEPIKVVVKPPPVVAKAPPPPPPPAPSKLPLYIGAGATGALAITSVVTGIIAVHEQHKFDNPKSSPAVVATSRRRGRILAHVTDACWIAGVAAGAFTAYWYLYRYRPAEHAPGTPAADDDGSKVGFAPWVQPGAGGLVVAGQF